MTVQLVDALNLRIYESKRVAKGQRIVAIDGVALIVEDGQTVLFNLEHVYLMLLRAQNAHGVTLRL